MLALLLAAAAAVTPTVDSKPEISGNCHPSRVHFTGRIAATVPGMVRYAWIRSDKPSTATFTLKFDAAGSVPVTYDWIVQGPASGWVVLHVIAPEDVHTDRIKFEVKCK